MGKQSVAVALEARRVSVGIGGSGPDDPYREVAEVSLHKAYGQWKVTIGWATWGAQSRESARQFASKLAEAMRLAEVLEAGIRDAVSNHMEES